MIEKARITPSLGKVTIADEMVAAATIELVDGGAGGHDPVVDGRIVDPGGAALRLALPARSWWLWTGRPSSRPLQPARS